MPIEKICIELTDACNLQCEMCYRKSWKGFNGHLEPEILEKLICEIEQFDTKPQLVLGGIGEPTIHPNFETLLNRLGSFDLTLTTNGTTIDRQMGQAIVENVSTLVISIDGNEESYERIRGFGLKKLRRNIELINELKQEGHSKGPELVIQMVISQQNIEEVPFLIKMASELRASQLILSNLLPASEEDETDILYTQGDGQAQKVKMSQLRNQAMRYGLTLQLTEVKLKTDRKCRFIESGVVVINSGGEVVPCYRFAHEGKEFVFGRAKQLRVHSFGSLKTSGLREIWNTKAYAHFRAMVLGNRYPSCPDCDLADGCDFVNSSDADCYGNMPSCADCLWARNIVYCV